jgi:hypothetical protein
MVDYRHVIHALRKKPMALLLASESEQQACSACLRSRMNARVKSNLHVRSMPIVMPALDRLRDRFKPARAAIPEVVVELVPLRRARHYVKGANEAWVGS